MKCEHMHFLCGLHSGGTENYIVPAGTEMRNKYWEENSNEK